MYIEGLYAQCLALLALSVLLLYPRYTLLCTVHFMLAFTLPCGTIDADYGIDSVHPRVGNTWEGAIGPIGIAGCILSLRLLEWGHVLAIT